MNDALQLYKSFIDEVVNRKEYVCAAWVLEGREFPDVDETNKKFNQLLSSLTTEEKEMLSHMLQKAYESGIHDLLALLDEKQDLDELVISEKGMVYPHDYFDSMHYDFICRREGDAWPED